MKSGLSVAMSRSSRTSSGSTVTAAGVAAAARVDALGGGVARLAAERAGVRLQTFVSRGDMPCGSTIGPVTAARTGAATFNVGAPMLAMHSARELAGARDLIDYAAFAAAHRPQRRNMFLVCFIKQLANLDDRVSCII